MTKTEAIDLMKKCKKLTHGTFLDHEYITMKGCSIIVTEEGYEVSAFDFWKYRTHNNFLTNWEIFE